MGDCTVNGCLEDHFLGAIGSCNLTSGRCICPPGYTGTDDYQDYNDCHVNETLQMAMYVLALSLSSILFLETLFGLIHLLNKYGFIWNPLTTTESTEESFENTNSSFRMRTANGAEGGVNSLAVNIGTEFMNSMDANMGSETSGKRPWSMASSKLMSSHKSIPKHARQVLKKNKVKKTMTKRARELLRRKVETLMVVTLFLCFAVGCMIYYIQMLRGQYRHTNNPLTDLGAALAVSTIFSGLWMLSYMWYASLPNIKVYGTLFGIHSVLLRHPRSVRYATIANIVFISLYNWIFVFIIPLASPGSRIWADQLALIGYLIFVSTFTVYFAALCRILHLIFGQLDVLSAQMNGGSVADLEYEDVTASAAQVVSAKEVSAFQHGLKLTDMMFRLTVFLGGISIVSALLAAFVDFFRSRLHVCICCVTVCASIIAMSLTFILVRRLQSNTGSSKASKSGNLVPRMNVPSSTDV